MRGSLKEIQPGSPQWTAWLKHYRGTKTEARMLSCLGDAKHGRPARPWLAPSEWPPEMPKAERLTSPAATRANGANGHSATLERPSVAEGALEEISSRLEAKQNRDDAETARRQKLTKVRGRSEATLTAALHAADENRHPDVADSDEFGLIEIEDPWEQEDLLAVGRGPALRVRKKTPLRKRVTALRDDPIGRLAKRGLLGRDEAECRILVRSARYYQQLYERIEIGGAKAFDITRGRVDCATMITPDSDARAAALDRLRVIDAALGSVGVEIVRAILISKLQFKQLAALNGGGQRNERYYGWRFQECLDCIAREAGFKPRPAPPLYHRDRHADNARFADQPELHAAVRRHELVKAAPNGHKSRGA